MDHASLKAEFLQETAPLIADLEQKLLAIERAAALLEDEWRAALSLLHTVKGNCGMMRYLSLIHI